MNSVVGAIGQCSEMHPDRDALRKGGLRVSYAQLWRQIVAAAGHFRQQGISRGDRILLAAPSAPAFVYGYFGAHLLGAIAVPIDADAPAPRRDEMIRRVNPKIVFGERAELHAAFGQCREIAELDELPASDCTFELPDLDLDADLLLTTGSTGRAKIVRLTHRNIAASAGNLDAVFGRLSNEIELLPLPLYHSFGLGRLRNGLSAGRTIVLVDGFRNPRDIFEQIAQHRATGMAAVPAGLAILLSFGPQGLGRFAGQLRYIETGSAPMLLERKRELMGYLPTTQIWMHYGLTEASRSTFLEFHRHHNRLDTVGRPAPNVTLNIRAENGAVLPKGESGVLWIGGAHVAPGYWDELESTRGNFANGWLRTGDVAHFDEDGFLILEGRTDNMLNVGGFNVSPEEVERVLREHPAVHDAACVGIPDPGGFLGQVLCAFVVLKAHAEIRSLALAESEHMDTVLSRWIGARIEPYKVPAIYRWVESLPMSESGKILRAELRGNAAAMFR